MSAGTDRGPIGAEPGQPSVARPASRLIGVEPEGAKAGLSTGVLRVALQEAMHARLEAFQAGERIYDELVKEAEARAGQILSEAQVEADRIVANARVEAERTLVDAVQQARALHDETTRQLWETSIALAEMRSQRSTLVRRLWGRLTGRPEDAADLPEEPPGAAPAAPTSAVAPTAPISAAAPSRGENAPGSAIPASTAVQPAAPFAPLAPSSAQAPLPSPAIDPSETLGGPPAKCMAPLNVTLSEAKGLSDEEMLRCAQHDSAVDLPGAPSRREAPEPVQKDGVTPPEKTTPAQGEKVINPPEPGQTLPPKGSWAIPDWLK